MDAGPGARYRASARAAAAGLAALLGASGLWGLLAPGSWYLVVPGVAHSGPFNAHFVQDIGAAYLSAAIGLAWYARRPLGGWPGAAGAVFFLGLHGLIHLHHASRSPAPTQEMLRDWLGVYAPALAATAIALLGRPWDQRP